MAEGYGDADGDGDGDEIDDDHCTQDNSRQLGTKYSRLHRAQQQFCAGNRAKPRAS